MVVSADTQHLDKNLEGYKIKFDFNCPGIYPGDKEERIIWLQPKIRFSPFTQGINEVAKAENSRMHYSTS